MIGSNNTNLKFISLCSGSSGNCYFIGDEDVSILIDAGISVRNIRRRLAEYNVEVDTIDLILLTHDHFDHIKHITALASKYNKPVYTTETLHKVLEGNNKNNHSAYKRVIEKEIPIYHKGVAITAFDVSHDAKESLGFYIDFKGERFTLITDLGIVSKRVLDYCKISNHVIIESNYDNQMLENGGYTQSLISRIKGDKGHLSNDQASAAVKEFFHDGICNIFLCHLSDNNNTPEIAYETTAATLREMGVSIGEGVKLNCLPRKDHKCYLI
ncbi:MBL fold metallo-hydrolase [Bacteroidota bacterium]